uniref:Uncharacterized protein n=1 Tax=viral metagenome TaxID=1070528 RepID=A0A6C0CDL4_9ZZZZ
MNYLLLLAGLVLVVCLMNSKDLMKSDLVKSVSSKSKSVSKSLGVDSTTLLVVVFVGAVLFMCMNKSVEGFTDVNPDTKNCDGGKKLRISDPDGVKNQDVMGCFMLNEIPQKVKQVLNLREIEEIEIQEIQFPATLPPESDRPSIPSGGEMDIMAREDYQRNRGQPKAPKNTTPGDKKS